MQDNILETGDSVLLNDKPELVKPSQSEPDVAPVYVADSTIHGKGVFAGRPFGEGELIGIYRGLPTEEDDTYVLWLYEDEEWYGIEGTGPLRFLNHSCKPNADFDGCELYALRDIPLGEEITFHYGEEWEDDCEEATAQPLAWHEEE